MILKNMAIQELELRNKVCALEDSPKALLKVKLKTTAGAVFLEAVTFNYRILLLLLAPRNKCDSRST